MENQFTETEVAGAQSQQFEILAATQILARDGQDAQKGSHVAENGLLETTSWLKNNGLLDEVLDGLEQGGFVKLKKEKDTPSELIFDRDLPGYAKSTVKVDLNKMQVNNKGKEQVQKEAAGERKDFVDALAGVKNRPIPDGEKKALDPLQTKMLQRMEEALSTGDLAFIKGAFQANAYNDGLWKRMEKEIAADFSSPPAVRYGKSADGVPYLAISGEGDNPAEDSQVILIRPTGKPQVVQLNDNGEIDFSKKSSQSPVEVMAKQHSYRLGELETKMSDYRCDFDEHERSSDKKFGPVSVKTIVEKYNTYTEHFCGSEFQD